MTAMGKKKRNKKNLANQAATKKNDEQPSMLPALIFFCGLLALVAPLLPSSAPSIPVTLTQASVFQALVAVMVAAWIPLAITDRRYRPHWGLLTFAVLGYGVMILVSLAFSADGDLSFWSQLWRMTGVWNMLHYVAWFVVLASVMKSHKDWRIFLAISCAFALYASLYGLKQWLASPMSASVRSTLGNQSLLAAYVLPHIFIAWYLNIANRAWSKYFYYTVMVACSATIIVSASRGAVLAWVISVALAVAALVALSKWPRKRRLALVSLIITLPVLAIGAVLLMRTPVAKEVVTSNIRVPRFFSRVVYRDIGEDRKLLWSYAWRGFTERPVYGWGNEMYGYLYDYYFDHTGEDIVIFNERWQDRAHNQYLDILVSYGVIGMLSVILIWFAVGRKLWLAFRATDERTEKKRLAMLAVFSVCYLTYVLTIFDTPAQLTVVFAVLALIATLSVDEKHDERLTKTNTRLRLAILAVCIPISLYVIWLNMAPVVRAAAVHEGLIAIRSDRQDMRATFSGAFKWPNAYVHGMRYAAIFEVQKYMELAQLNSADMHDGLEYLVEQAVDSAEDRPLTSRYLIGASTALRLLAMHEPEKLDDAEMYAQKIIDLMPNRFDGYAEMAEINILRGEFQEAIAQLKKAEERVYARRRDLQSRIYMLMATAYAGLGQIDRVVECTQKAGELDQNAFFDSRLAIILSKNIQFGDNIVGLDGYLNILQSRYSQVSPVMQAVAKIIQAGSSTSVDVGTTSLDESAN